MTKRVIAGVGALAVAAIVALALWRGRGGATTGSTPAPAPQPARYVGRAQCAKCHAKQDALWQGSDHDLAMQVADSATVLGDFGGARFTYHGVTSTFFKRDGKHLVRTDGPDGKLHEYEIAYTFGVYPLQQYLIAFPGGRYQALNVCWDTRPAREGGQRWFHLYPNENVSHEHAFHWTGPYQNWNFMCAECHSTNVRKGYHATEDRYETTWFEIDVSCEACHGPGSAHAAWGEAVESGRAGKGDREKGLAVVLADPAARTATWTFDSKRGTAQRSVPRTSQAELETCARCHARRAAVSDDYVHGRPILDTHRPALLDEALYHADGQIEDEVYEYASFVQSRMHAKGVTCSDCHDPHSLKVGASTNAVCVRCHLQERFDTPSHHFHEAGSQGASCVECHMPARKYMVVDPRRDHSFRVPRPDLTLKIGTPNACSGCHRDRSPEWAARAAAKWWGPERAAQPHYGEALHAGRAVLPGAERGLARLADDSAQPPITRATAVALLGGYLSPRSLPSIQRALEDTDPLIRLAALGALSALPAAERARLAAPLLSDPVRNVRMDAARAVALLPAGSLEPERQRAFEAAFAEYQEAQRVTSDRAEAHLNLGALAAERGLLAEAQREYETALRLNRWLPAVYVNLADLERQRGNDAEAERVLRRGLVVAPDEPDLHQALGFALVRQKRLAEALSSLARSAELGTGRPRYAYVYAVALKDAGRTDRALAVLRAAHERHPGDPELLLALATFSREKGSLADAASYARKLVELVPDDPAARRLIEEMEAAAQP